MINLEASSYVYFFSFDKFALFVIAASCVYENFKPILKNFIISS